MCKQRHDTAAMGLMLRQMLSVMPLDNPLKPRKKQDCNSTISVSVSHLFVMAGIQKPEPWVIMGKSLQLCKLYGDGPTHCTVQRHIRQKARNSVCYIINDGGVPTANPSAWENNSEGGIKNQDSVVKGTFRTAGFPKIYFENYSTG